MLTDIFDIFCTEIGRSEKLICYLEAEVSESYEYRTQQWQVECGKIMYNVW